MSRCRHVLIDLAEILSEHIFNTASSSLCVPLLERPSTVRRIDIVRMPTTLSCCCLLTTATSLCLLGFFYLHAANADGGAGRPWSIVFAPAVLLAIVILFTLIFAPFMLPPHSQPSLRAWGTWGLSAAAAIAIAVRIATTADGGASLVSWRMALSPLGGALVVRAATVPPELPPALGGPDAEGVGCWRILARLELPLGLISLALADWQLEAPGAARGWWAAAAPLVVLEALSAVAGVRAFGAMTRASSAPSLRVATDRVEWVRAHEGLAISVGTRAVAGGIFRAGLLCSLAGQLDARADARAAKPAAGGDSPPSWSAAYLPYTMLLSMMLCCVCCCAWCTPPVPARTVAPAGHARENGSGGGGGGGGASASARRRVVGSEEAGHGRSESGGSSDGTAPLLSNTSDGEAPGHSPAEPGGVSPHLL